MSRITGIICSPRIYEFRGWTFEVSGWGGDHPKKIRKSLGIKL